MNALGHSAVGKIPVEPETPDETILGIVGLNAGYQHIHVLRDVTFSVSRGEIFAIVGTNGAGKSTLLRTISGLIAPMSGSINFEGTDIAGCNAADIVRHGISQSPEGRRCFAGLTVDENLRLGAFSRRTGSPALGERLENVYGYFPRLRERRRQLAGTLSGGEQQMCALGRALMALPRLLIVDELSLGLAPIIVEELLLTLQGIHQAGTTIMLVEQDVGVALGFSDRAIVIQQGQIVLQGYSEHLLESEHVVKSYLGGVV
ncbi:ABC transporter ATP-binding protein [Bradyrhizobium sp. LjRoot220]|uniref:ABC transporter ATP-binding protein n=1 Tax=Bradyrhizobium sp. LjRoot220 TaxID=3342284 RepID=UPI003ECE629B